MDKKKLYISLCIAYLGLSLTVAFTYYIPSYTQVTTQNMLGEPVQELVADAGSSIIEPSLNTVAELAKYSSFGILEPREEVVLTEQVILASSYREIPIYNPLKIQTAAASEFERNTELNLTGYMSLEDSIVAESFSGFTWLILLAVVFGQAIMIYGLAYHREWAKSTIAAVMISFAFLLPPSVKAVGSIPEVMNDYREFVYPGDVMTIKLVYQNFSEEAFENVDITIPVPAGTRYIPESIMISDVEAYISNHVNTSLIESDVPGDDSSSYDLESREIRASFQNVPKHSLDTGGFISFKLKVKDRLEVSDIINIFAVAETDSGISTEASFLLGVDQAL